MTTLLPSPAGLETDGLRLIDDEVLAIIAIRRLPWPSVFVTSAEQRGEVVDDVTARRMVERGALSLLARGLAAVVDGRLTLGTEPARLLDMTQAGPHTVVCSGTSQNPLDAQWPCTYFCRHDNATLIDMVHGNGLRTVRLAPDAECREQIVATASSAFHAHRSDTSRAVHIAHPRGLVPEQGAELEPGDVAVTAVTAGSIATGHIGADGAWTVRSETPFWDGDRILTGWVSSSSR